MKTIPVLLSGQRSMDVIRKKVSSYEQPGRIGNIFGGLRFFKVVVLQVPEISHARLVGYFEPVEAIYAFQS